MAGRNCKRALICPRTDNKKDQTEASSLWLSGYFKSIQLCKTQPFGICCPLSVVSESRKATTGRIDATLKVQTDNQQPFSLSVPNLSCLHPAFQPQRCQTSPYPIFQLFPNTPFILAPPFFSSVIPTLLFFPAFETIVYHLPLL